MPVSPADVEPARNVNSFVFSVSWILASTPISAVVLGELGRRRARLLAVDKNAAKVRAADLTLDSRDEKVFRGRDEISRTAVERLPGLHVQHAYVISADFPAHAGAAENRDRDPAFETDAPREEKIDFLGSSERKGRGVLEKERGAFPEKTAESGSG